MRLTFAHYFMNYLLHIDTSTDTGTVAIGGNGTLLAQRINEESRNHAGTLNIMINDVLAEVGIALDQLSGIVVCAGPGSYTGLRIGMATAKGFCYALDKPLLLDDRLSLMAYKEFNKELKYNEYISLLTAREKEYFISIHDANFSNILEPQHVFSTQLNAILENRKNVYIITDVPENEFYYLKVNNLEVNNNIKVDVKSWVFYAYEKYKSNNIVNLSLAEPFYLKQVYTHK